MTIDELRAELRRAKECEAEDKHSCVFASNATMRWECGQRWMFSRENVDRLENELRLALVPVAETA